MSAADPNRAVIAQVESPQSYSWSARLDSTEEILL